MPKGVPNGNSSDQILTVREAADYLRVHQVTIYRLLNDGELPGFRLGGSWRFSRAALAKHLERNTIRAY